MQESDRLENLWAGEFGDSYTERCKEVADRTEFWKNILKFHPRSILELGCNVGANLFFISQISRADLYGIDVNRAALKIAYPVANYLRATAKNVPFKDCFFDLVFTCGVLIHQPEETLPRVLGEMYRLSRKYVLFAEYGDEETHAIPYRGNEKALFRRNYEQIWQQMYPETVLIEKGRAGKDQGFDDVSWCLWEK
jgi:pseudaminic acid biosynthesis-associated methylase